MSKLSTEYLLMKTNSLNKEEVKILDEHVAENELVLKKEIQDMKISICKYIKNEVDRDDRFDSDLLSAFAKLLAI